MASVTLSGVKKRFGALEIIREIDLNIEDGEFVVLVGPSGCGKSTLLRMIAGLESITAGEARIDGKVVNNVAAKNRDIAMVFQNYALYPHKTVRQNIEFSLRLRKAPKAEMDRKVNDAAELLALTPLLDRTPRALSGGQRQRVAMGRAIVRDPKVFLFDEPLSNLDAKLRVEMRAQIKALHRRLGATSVYVTHDQVEAMTMGDKIVVMRGGEIQQMGRPIDVYDAPRNLFVAGFIGSPSMNLMPARLDGDGFAIAGARFDWGQVGQPNGVPQDFICGVRPEDLLLVPRGEGIDGVVAVVEPMGGETVASVAVGDAHYTVLFRDRRPLEVGDKVGLVPQVDMLHLFNPVTEARIDPSPMRPTA
ncbi:ABC transporter ATP-binding protein [Roseicitreum antarcticum]|uniref:Carbohydrate ABC transporter ATP-binding protein, CUT1 family (TC 3.A.1.1.-) n=1 Tax=Roseicitreum antarcticum TaxID=564137 RepID=A0A1H3FGW8_9RHOB|nr:sn-glycerol-3-phosphate ABC transporter ATP-binding protein UgpC [Roseicitreum antarcticum]SDX89628.1 carbohydrate ABC transporter ATP-binding protein, CUT1 family (TC 3.A.1.1.-) [Roseicitreum antarcticum]